MGCSSRITLPASPETGLEPAADQKTSRGGRLPPRL